MSDPSDGRPTDSGAAVQGGQVFASPVPGPPHQGRKVPGPPVTGLPQYGEPLPHRTMPGAAGGTGEGAGSSTSAASDHTGSGPDGTQEAAAASDAALPSTGDRSVDEALESLSGVLDRPLAEQVDVYAGAHRQLQDRLADLDG